jgi:hypothetical protein
MLKRVLLGDEQLGQADPAGEGFELGDGVRAAAAEDVGRGVREAGAVCFE